MNESCKKKTGTKEWAQENVNFLQCTCGMWKCRNNCWYCYAKNMAVRFHQCVGYDLNHQVTCGDPKIVMPKSLPREKVVMMPSSHDLFPEHLPEIKHILFELLNRGNSVLLVSKPRKDVIQPLIGELGRWQKVFGKQIDTSKVEFRFSITSATDAISLKYEPGAPLPQERVECLKMVIDAGFDASVSMEPYLEDPISITHFITRGLEDFRYEFIKEIWIGAMNYGAPPELKHLYTLDSIHQIFQFYTEGSIWETQIRWKDSFQQVLGIDCRGQRRESK